MELSTLLTSLGINIASSVIWDFIKSSISRGKTKEEIIKELANFIQVEGADIKSQEIIEFFINNGQLYIENSQIYSKESIDYSTSINDSSLTMKNSTSKTNNTEISVCGSGATIKMSGNAQIIQNEKGITISVGNNK